MIMESDWNVLAELESNLEGEHYAIKGYYNLLALLQRWGDEYDSVSDQIHEIISDELNHSEKLHNILSALSDIKPAKD